MELKMTSLKRQRNWLNQRLQFTKYVNSQLSLIKIVRSNGSFGIICQSHKIHLGNSKERLEDIDAHIKYLKDIKFKLENDFKTLNQLKKTKLIEK
jgi:hypothetical protein